MPPEPRRPAGAGRELRPGSDPGHRRERASSLVAGERPWPRPLPACGGARGTRTPAEARPRPPSFSAMRDTLPLQRSAVEASRDGRDGRVPCVTARLPLSSPDPHSRSSSNAEVELPPTLVGAYLSAWLAPGRGIVARSGRSLVDQGSFALAESGGLRRPTSGPTSSSIASHGAPGSPALFLPHSAPPGTRPPRGWCPTRRSGCFSLPLAVLLLYWLGQRLPRRIQWAAAAAFAVVGIAGYLVVGGAQWWNWGQAAVMPLAVLIALRSSDDGPADPVRTTTDAPWGPP